MQKNSFIIKKCVKTDLKQTEEDITFPFFFIR